MAKKRTRRLTVTDVIPGYSVRIVRKDGSTFVASVSTPDNPLARAFFYRHAKARAYVKELREHGMTGRVVRARSILESE